MLHNQVKANKPKSDEIAELTQEFLSKGKKIDYLPRFVDRSEFKPVRQRIIEFITEGKDNAYICKTLDISLVYVSSVRGTLKGSKNSAIIRSQKP